MAEEGTEQENTGTTFDILFRGELAPDNNLEQVKARVAESFKLDEAAVSQLFSGATVSLKRNIDKATAERIYQRLSEAGAVAKIVPSDSSKSISNNSTSNNSPANESTFNESTSNESTANESTADQSSLNQAGGKAFTLAPLGSDVLEGSATPEQEQESIPVDHLGLEPVGSNIIEEGEAETIEPVVVDTSHLTLE